MTHSTSPGPPPLHSLASPFHTHAILTPHSLHSHSHTHDIPIFTPTCFSTPHSPASPLHTHAIPTPTLPASPPHTHCIPPPPFHSRHHPAPNFTCFTLHTTPSPDLYTCSLTCTRHTHAHTLIPSPTHTEKKESINTDRCDDSKTRSLTSVTPGSRATLHALLSPATLSSAF